MIDFQHEETFEGYARDFHQYEEIRAYERERMRSENPELFILLFKELLSPEIFEFVYDSILPKVNFVQTWNAPLFHLEDGSTMNSRWADGTFRSCGGPCRVMVPSSNTP